MHLSLHNRSCYSFCSALTTPKQLADFARQYGMEAIAITDLHGLYAAVPFQQACDEAGVRPIFGAEIAIDLDRFSKNDDHAQRHRHPTRADTGGKPVPHASQRVVDRREARSRRADRDSTNTRCTVTLLARDLIGYGNLCRLISTHHLREESLTFHDLASYSEGLICLIGDIRRIDGRVLSHTTGPNGQTTNAICEVVAIASHDETQPGKSIQQLRCAFDRRLYVELSIHTREDVVHARKRAAAADALGVPVVATSASRCVRRSQMPILRALSSIGTLTLLDAPHPDKPRGTHHLRTPEEMNRLFARRPDALENTRVIADQCNVSLDMAQNRFPPFESPDGRSAMTHLRERSIAGCRRRYVDEPQQRGIGGKRPTLTEALERLERELRIIEQVRYAEYFLVFHEIVEHCRSKGIATLARGSAADSLICYALGVSHACPFRFDLPFDRFVNPERAKFSKMADIDLDLPWDRRDEVIHWVYDRWGHDRVAMIGLPHTFHGRAAVAELGKVFGLPPHEVYRVTKLLPRVSANDLSEAIEASPETRDLPVAEEPFRTIIRMAGALEGLPRHWAMHPCGMVVSPHPITELIPVQRSPKSMLIAQYDMDAIEDLGFIKIDLLGQAGLSVLRDAVAEIERTEDVAIDLERDVDYSDGPTWEMIATGEARGVHHIESPAMTSLIKQCNTREIDGLTTIVAIIRPGAANQGKKDAYARRYQGFERPTFSHPALVPVLEKTLGLMVFEEHILQVAVEFAGMNLGRADVLRRALNRENRALIRELKGEFVRCARRKGRAQKEIDAVWPMLEGFAGFMFNKAHSAEYAVEAFQGAWLKRRFPAHYVAAILSNYRGFYASSPTLPQILYVLEALRLGAGFLPPCVNRSRERFCIEYASHRMDGNGESTAVSVGRASVPAEFDSGRSGTTAPLLNDVPRTLPNSHPTQPIHARRAGHPMIRVPVSHINGLSQALIDRYRTERALGAFSSLADFVGRCRPSESDGRLLLDSGALDGFGRSRPETFWMLRGLSKRRTDHADTLWGNDEQEAEPPPVDLVRPGARQIAAREMELLGFPVSIDPLSYLGRDDQGREIDWSRYTPVRELNRRHGRRVEVCGLMVACRTNRTTTGDLMKFVTLADRTGFIETFLFPDVYQRFGHLTVANPILAATALVEPFENGNGCALRVQQVALPARRTVR